MTHYAVHMTDGSVAIMQTIEQPDGEEMSPEDVIADWPSELQDGVASFNKIDIRSIPTDRTFRDAWTASGKTKIGHDLKKARDILRDRLRAKRQPYLEALDVEYQRASETRDQDGQLEIVKQKQRLRDITADPSIEAAKTIQDLISVHNSMMNEDYNAPSGE